MSSRRIKDALPHEVVDKIRSSSLRAKTIAIIEPVQKNKKKAEAAAGLTLAPSRIVRHATAAGIGIGMGGITSRFQEAGISLSRNRFRNLTGSGVVHGPQTVPPPIPPQSPRQAQVNLDHDYCSSNKARRNRERSGGGGTPYVVGKASPRPSGSPPGGASPGGGGNKTVIRVSSTPVNMKRLRESTSHVVAVARSNAPLAAAILAASTKPDPPSPSLPKTMTTTHYNFGSGFHLQQQQRTVTVVKTEPVASGSIDVKEEPIFDESSNSPSPPPISASSSSSRGPRSTQRRDSDPGRKDSGLESGDVSDSSLNNEDEMYSRLPPYLTVLPPVVKVEGDGGAAEDEEMSSAASAAVGGYDRLPGYVKGLSRSASPVMDLKGESLEQVRPTTRWFIFIYLVQLSSTLELKIFFYFE